MTTLAADDLRSRRDYLPDDDFALVSEDPDPPTDRIAEDDWRGMMALPDDAVLRTTTFQGAVAGHCNDMWLAVVGTIPGDRAESSPVFEAILDLADHFRAASFSTIHGFYRQSFATVRSAVELMVITARLSKFDGMAVLRSWRYGEGVDLKIHFAQDLDRLAQTDTFALLNEAMAPSVFAQGKGNTRSGWVWSTYRVLSRFTHGQPGYTDGELWHSNGPIWVPDTFVLYVEKMREVLGISTLFARATDPQLHLAEDLLRLFAFDGEEWTPGLRRALEALGVNVE